MIKNDFGQQSSILTDSLETLFSYLALAAALFTLGVAPTFDLVEDFDVLTGIRLGLEVFMGVTGSDSGA